MIDSNLWLTLTFEFQTNKTDNKMDTYKSNITDGTAELVLDHIKNFSIEVSRKKDNQNNIILFELLNIERYDL